MNLEESESELRSDRPVGGVRNPTTEASKEEETYKTEPENRGLRPTYRLLRWELSWVAVLLVVRALVGDRHSDNALAFAAAQRYYSMWDVQLRQCRGALSLAGHTGEEFCLELCTD